MTKYFLSFAIIFLSFSRAFCFTNLPYDSVAVEKRGNKTFILHRVDSGQTLFSILKKYNCTKAEFAAANPYLNGSDKIGFDQIIRIPVKAKVATPVKTTPPLIAKTEIIKEVSKLDTSKKEKTSPEVEIIELNPTGEDKPAETIIQKESVFTNSTTPPILATKTAVKTPKTHKVVSPTETLFGIATKYKVKAADLIKWNNLKSNFVQLGQVLLVESPILGKDAIAKTAVEKPVIKVPIKAKKDSVAVIKIVKKPKKDSLSITKVILKKPKKDSVTVAKVLPKKPKKDSIIAKVKPPVKVPTKVVQGPAGDSEKTKSIPKPDIKPTTVPTYVPNAPGGKKVFENGIAEVIDGGGSTDKYLALHKTAPVGTLIQVRNEASGLSVWVKVIGRLPESSETIIKISPKAFEKLQPNDKRIRAVVSYVK